MPGILVSYFKQLDTRYLLEISPNITFSWTWISGTVQILLIILSGSLQHRSRLEQSDFILSWKKIFVDFYPIEWKYKLLTRETRSQNGRKGKFQTHERNICVTEEGKRDTVTYNQMCSLESFLSKVPGIKLFSFDVMQSLPRHRTRTWLNFRR